MGTVVIVLADPGPQRIGSQGRGSIGPAVGPAALERLDEALGLAVGPGRVGARLAVPQPSLLAKGLEGMGGVSLGVIDQHTLGFGVVDNPIVAAGPERPATARGRPRSAGSGSRSANPARERGGAGDHVDQLAGHGGIEGRASPAPPQPPVARREAGRRVLGAVDHDGALVREMVHARLESGEPERVAVLSEVGLAGPEQAQARLLRARNVGEGRGVVARAVWRALTGAQLAAGLRVEFAARTGQGRARRSRGAPASGDRSRAAAGSPVARRSRPCG